ncbi:MAG: hypothetical protein ACXWXP_04925 [Actinomycetota bacterium]
MADAGTAGDETEEVGMMKRIMGVALAGALALTIAGAVPASAGDRDVERRSSCSASTDWKLKLSPEDGGLEVEYEVDSNVNGQRWKVKLFKDGNRIFNGTRITQGPSGSFEVRVVASGASGTFRAKAVNRGTGETCTGSASI